jgi:membrane-associated phospholipid phosphatase
VDKKIALGLSVVLQPLAMPTFISVVILYLVPQSTSIPDAAKGSLLILITLTTLVIPLLSIAGMKFTKSIESFEMPEKRERILPFSLISVFYLMTSFFFYFRIRVDQLVLTTLLMVTACLMLITLITYFWKISAHLAGIGGLLAVIVLLSMKYGTGSLFYPFLLTILACGALGSARLALDAHKPLEVYGGFILGFLWSGAFYYYILFLG